MLVVRPAGGAEAREIRTVTADRLGPGKRALVFPLRNVRPAALRAGRLRIGRRRKRIGLRKLRRGLRGGALRIQLRNRRSLRLARRHGARLRLVLRSLPEFDGYSSYGGSLRRTRFRFYDGSRSLRARFSGSPDGGFQRVWRDVRWRSGSDVWYGMAVFVPDVDAYCYWNPMRWDNYRTYGSGGDVGGLAVEKGRVSLIRNRYGDRERRLTVPVPLPERRWVWLEVHQRLSALFGRALSEVYLDGRRVALSRSANSSGRVVNHVRFGAVNIAGSCSRSGHVYFDRVMVRQVPLGPLVPLLRFP